MISDIKSDKQFRSLQCLKQVLNLISNEMHPDGKLQNVTYILFSRCGTMYTYVQKYIRGALYWMRKSHNNFNYSRVAIISRLPAYSLQGKMYTKCNNILLLFIVIWQRKHFI